MTAASESVLGGWNDGHAAAGKAGSLTGAGDADVIGSELAGRQRQHRYRSLQRLSRDLRSRPRASSRSAETKQLNHTYTGLTCGTDYSLALVAEDAAGNKSDLAEAIWYPVRTLACDPSSPPPPPSGGTPDTQPPTTPSTWR